MRIRTKNVMRVSLTKSELAPWTPASCPLTFKTEFTLSKLLVGPLFLKILQVNHSLLKALYVSPPD